MSGRASVAYQEHQMLESVLVLKQLLDDADRYKDIIQRLTHITFQWLHYTDVHSRRRFAVSIVLGISYGRRAASLEDEMVKSNAAAIAGLSDCISHPYWRLNSVFAYSSSLRTSGTKVSITSCVPFPQL